VSYLESIEYLADIVKESCMNAVYAIEEIATHDTDSTDFAVTIDGCKIHGSASEEPPSQRKRKLTTQLIYRSSRTWGSPFRVSTSCVDLKATKASINLNGSSIFVPVNGCQSF
jgi:hypothetical protein